MKTATIRNPKTNRQIKVRVWDITTADVYAALRDGKTVKDISWDLLNQKASVDTAASEMGGDDAASNFALGVFVCQPCSL